MNKSWTKRPYACVVRASGLCHCGLPPEAAIHHRPRPQPHMHPAGPYDARYNCPLCAVYGQQEAGL